jgi:hypothetical protein
MSVRSRQQRVGFGFVLAVAFVVPAAAVPSSSANLIVNGGFEQPFVGVGAYKLVATGQSFAGWRVVGAAGNVGPISGTFNQNGIHFTAKAGKQWLDLTGVSNTKTGVAQTVKTSSGTSYRLSFAVGNVRDPGGIFGTTSTIDVVVNGHQLLAATNKGGSKTQAWKTFTATIKATSAATTIEFLNGDPSTDNDNGLDAVSISRR